MNPTTTDEEYIEIPVVLKLKKNISELLRILSIVYNEYPTLNNEMLNKFLSKEVTKIVKSLAESPPESERLPANFQRYLRNMLNDTTTTTNDDIIKKYTTTKFPSKEQIDRWMMGKIPEEEDDNKEDLK